MRTGQRAGQRAGPAGGGCFGSLLQSLVCMFLFLYLVMFLNNVVLSESEPARSGDTGEAVNQTGNQLTQEEVGNFILSTKFFTY